MTVSTEDRAPADMLPGSNAERRLSCPVPVLSPRTLHQLGLLLRSRGYAVAQEMLTPIAQTSPPNPPFEQHLLRRLFARGEILPAAQAAQALAPVSLSSLIDAGLLERSEDRVRALFQVQVFSGLLFVVDFMPREHPADVVLPIGPSGRYLASLTIRQKVDSALDLGCGCGVQALLMASHARHVTATDINPRALALTRLNAALNDVRNIETLQGSYFEPLGRRAFDLIVANLPYVITPDSRYVYRDLGGADDGLIRHNVQDMPAHLTEGGFAQIMLNWIHKAEEGWWRPLESWTSRRNVDAWLIYSRSMTPAEYAKQWITLSESEQPEEYARIRERWLHWYAAQGIERIGFGALALRQRTAQDNWRCSVMSDRAISEPLGGHIRHLFHSQDCLGKVRDAGELASRVLKPVNSTVVPAAAETYEVRTTAGFYLRQVVHAGTARVIACLDGKASLQHAIRRVGLPAQDAAAQQQVLEELYQLINLGLIEVVQ